MGRTNHRISFDVTRTAQTKNWDVTQTHKQQGHLISLISLKRYGDTQTDGQMQVIS
jgi:hypothetical protein